MRRGWLAGARAVCTAQNYPTRPEGKHEGKGNWPGAGHWPGAGRCPGDPGGRPLPWAAMQGAGPGCAQATAWWGARRRGWGPGLQKAKGRQGGVGHAGDETAGLWDGQSSSMVKHAQGPVASRQVGRYVCTGVDAGPIQQSGTHLHPRESHRNRRAPRQRGDRRLLRPVIACGAAPRRICNCLSDISSSGCSSDICPSRI